MVLGSMCSPSCRNVLSWVIFLFYFGVFSLMKLMLYLWWCPLPAPLKQLTYYLPGSFTGLLFPRNVHCLSVGKELLHISCSQLALHMKPEDTALPFQVHTVDSWALRTCVKIKAKLFMMDDITDNDTVMAGSMDWICRWLEWHRWFHPWSNLKQLWCNPFCIKEKKKHWIWLMVLPLADYECSLSVQSVATVPSLFFQSRGISGFCFWFLLFLFLNFCFDPWTILTM